MPEGVAKQLLETKNTLVCSEFADILYKCVDICPAELLHIIPLHCSIKDQYKIE